MTCYHLDLHCLQMYLYKFVGIKKVPVSFPGGKRIYVDSPVKNIGQTNYHEQKHEVLVYRMFVHEDMKRLMKYLFLLIPTYVSCKSL